MNPSPKYHFTSRLTEELYLRYNHAINFRQPKMKLNRILTSVIATAIIIALLYYFNTFENFQPYVIYIVAAVILVFTYWQFPRNIKKQARQNFRTTNMSIEWEFSFYDDHFEVKSPMGDSSHRYTDLTDIVLTDQDIYLMYAPNMGYCMTRDVCPAGFDLFIENLRNKRL